MKSHTIICILALGIESTIAFQAPRNAGTWSRPTSLKSMNDLYGPGSPRGEGNNKDTAETSIEPPRSLQPPMSPPPPAKSDSAQVFGGSFSPPPQTVPEPYQPQRLTPRYNDAPPAALRRQNVKTPYGNGPQGVEGFRDGRQTYDTTFSDARPYNTAPPRTAQSYNSPGTAQPSSLSPPQANFNDGMSEAARALAGEIEAEKAKPVKDYNRLKQLKSMMDHEMSLDEERKKLMSELQIAEADENYDKCEELQYQLQELSYQSPGARGVQGGRGQMQLYDGRGRQGGLSRGRQAALARGGIFGGYGYGTPLGYNGVSMYNGPYAPGYNTGARRWRNRGYMNGYGYNGYNGYNGYGGYYPYGNNGYGGYGMGGYGMNGYGYGAYGYGGYGGGWSYGGYGYGPYGGSGYGPMYGYNPYNGYNPRNPYNYGVY